jgi:hypothetical protein
MLSTAAIALRKSATAADDAAFDFALETVDARSITLSAVAFF